jgi:gluconolactonase
VIDDLVRPNGLIGTQDGRLFVTDHGANKTFVYKINADGTLSDKTLFVSIGGDGMTIDSKNNVYLAATDGIVVFTPDGNQKEIIAVPERPTNICFGGADGQTLFITARSTLYTIPISAGDDRGRD